MLLVILRQTQVAISIPNSRAKEMHQSWAEQWTYPTSVYWRSLHNSYLQVSKSPSKVNQNTSIKHKNTIGSIVVQILSINKIKVSMNMLFRSMFFYSIIAITLQRLNSGVYMQHIKPSLCVFHLRKGYLEGINMNRNIV